MILDDLQRKRLASISRSTQGKHLFEFLELVKAHVADIRNDIPCKPEIEREVRLATCDAIEELIVQTIKRAGVERSEFVENEFV